VYLPVDGKEVQMKVTFKQSSLFYFNKSPNRSLDRTSREDRNNFHHDSKNLFPLSMRKQFLNPKRSLKYVEVEERIISLYTLHPNIDPIIHYSKRK
jgi:hypothetical protein